MPPELLFEIVLSAMVRVCDSVEFDVGQGPKGPRAENVRRTST